MDTDASDLLFKNFQRNIITSASTGEIGNYSKAFETWKRCRNIYAFFEEECAKKEGHLKVLDLGTSYGQYIFLLNASAHRQQNAFFYGFDLSRTRLQIAQQIKNNQRLANVAFVAIDIEKMNLKNAVFDIVIAAEVIEHLKDPKSFLQTVFKTLKPGGLLILTTPNKDNAILRFKGIFNALPHKIVEPATYLVEQTEENSGYEHISVKKASEWKALFDNTNFILEKIKRGAVSTGSSKFNRRPILFSFMLFFDTLFDILPIANNFSENFTYKLRKPS